MAEYKMVDAQQLDADLTAVADAIRERASTTEAMEFPGGFVSAVEGIPDTFEAYLLDTLTEYYHPTLTTVKHFGFAYCNNLQKVALPEVSQSGYFGFQHTEKMTEAIMPKLTIIDHNGLACSGLTKVDFPLLSTISAQGLEWTPVNTLILRKTDALCSLEHVNGLANTPIAGGTGYIYVPSELVDSYKAATNWSTYAAQFRALEDYTVDGTTTGELDESKI